MTSNNSAKRNDLNASSQSPKISSTAPIVGRERVKLIKVSKCCDDASKLLFDINKNVEMIIDFKKKQSSKSGIDQLLFSEVGKYVDVLKQLGKIDSSLKQTIGRVQSLCKVARKMLGTGLAPAKAVGLGLGTKAAHEEDKEDKKGDE